MPPDLPSPNRPSRPSPVSLQSPASVSVVLDCPDRLASVCRDRTAERSQSAVISPCWNVRNPACGVGVGHAGPKGFGHRRGNTWTHTTVCFNGFCIPNLKLGLFFFQLETMLKPSGIKQTWITPAGPVKYLLLQRAQAFFFSHSYYKKYGSLWNNR